MGYRINHLGDYNILDEMASAFLRRHGTHISAEPESQFISWCRWRSRPKIKGPHVPLAAFFDLPRPLRMKAASNPCQDCGGRRSVGSAKRCDRCRKGIVRAAFVDTWTRRASDAQSLSDAILTQSVWAGPEGERYRVVVAPTATEYEEVSALKEAFSRALEDNAEPEVFRQILSDLGFGEFIRARDEHALAVIENRRRKLVQYNHDCWADPERRAKKTATNKATKRSPEQRKKYSDLRRAMWADPSYRKRATAGIVASKNTPEARSKFAELLKARWEDPVMRAKYTAGNQARAKARGDAARGRKQSPEQIAHRMAATAATKAAKGPYKQSPEVIANRVEKTRLTLLRKKESGQP